MSQRSFRIALIIVASSVAVLAISVGIAVMVALDYPDRVNPGTADEVVVDVARGLTFPEIAERLHQAGVIDRPLWFRIYAMRRGVTTDVRSGKYALRGDMTPKEVLDRLLEGVKQKTVAVTIPEGLHMLETFARIAEGGVADAAALERLARNPSFLKGLGITGETVEGYLFPDTYQLVVPTAPEKVLETLIKQQRAVFKRVVARNRDAYARLKKKPLEWSDRDILIMASIVEKEAVVPSEQPRIAQVFINRITDPKFRPKLLQTDPTIRYGCTIPLTKSEPCKIWDPTQRLRTKQLRDRDNPYNTYQHPGLPPGPIGNPGEGAIEATINPDGSEYYFFVSRNDGTHVFSKTEAEHNRAVDRFQR
jgi:UPF0755 protein